jgi:PKD repeat protein
VVTVTSPANQPPVATIGAPAGNVTVAQGGTVNFQGSGTDPNNNLPLTYNWNFGGGAANSTAQNPGAVTFNTAGTFTVSFTATDSLGLASTPVTRIVTVMGVGQQPVAIIEEPKQDRTIARGRSIEFHATADNTDEDDDDLIFNWSFPGGTPVNSFRKEVKVFFHTAGIFTVTLTATDSQGRVSAPVSRVVTVTGPANMAPTASIDAPAGDVTVAQGGTVNFQGSGADPDNNTPLTYNWDFGGGAPNFTVQDPGAVTFDTAGTFTVTFTVIDSLGLSSTPVTRTVTVTPPANMAPTAAINAPVGNVTVAQGGTVNFQGSGVDPDGNTPLTYNWNFGGGAPNSTAQNPGAVRFGTAGTFTVTFTVNDSLGLASTPVTRTVTVTPAGMPVADIVAPVMNVSVLPGGRVTFRGAASGSANLPLRFRWTFQGGSPQSSTRQNPSAVRFTEVGMHTVTLTVTDSKGQVSMPVTRVVTVAPPNASRIRLDDRCFGDNNNDDDNDDDDDD